MVSGMLDFSIKVFSEGYDHRGGRKRPGDGHKFGFGEMILLGEAIRSGELRVRVIDKTLLGFLRYRK